VEHADSVGFAMPVVDLALHEPDEETGVGELLVRGQNVVQGYWNKPEATAETFVDGWLHTGDLARIDHEGLLYIVDRAKDMINRGGETSTRSRSRARWPAPLASARPLSCRCPTR
jgi:long-chain acyl-CoA synthetase